MCLIVNDPNLTLIYVAVAVQFSQLELSVSEGAGFVRDLVLVERLGRTEQNLTIRLQVDIQDGAVQGMV